VWGGSVRGSGLAGAGTRESRCLFAAAGSARLVRPPATPGAAGSVLVPASVRAPMNFHETPRFPRGFRCASRNVGLKPEGKDLSLFVSEVPAAAAAVFTRNLCPGAPVVVGREIVCGGRLRAVVVNSKVSNVGTGEAGIANARRMGAAAAAEVGCPPDEVLMSSTGVIGVPLPIERIEAGIRGMAAELQDDPLVGARGIMTTDTHPKALSCSVGGATITWVAKGSGMIEPNMATMLVYIFTDAALRAATLDAMLREAVEDSFNMLSVDGDTSTSDTCVVLANGVAGAVEEGAFRAALRDGCLRMTEILARDGEGASKLIRARVEGAASRAEARRIAKSLINSPLVKTMAFGADPNIGRVLMAVGKCFECEVRPERIRVWINEVEVFGDGTRREYDEPRLREILAGDPVEIRVDLGVGEGAATAFGCDLTHGYIDENAAYYSS
jgi:glutamate N-acetyltransferase / amino-acid N-acetyltransferase